MGAMLHGCDPGFLDLVVTPLCHSIRLISHRLSQLYCDANLAGAFAMHYTITGFRLLPGHRFALNRVEQLISHHHAPASSSWLLILEPKLEQNLRWYLGLGEPHEIWCGGHTYWISRHVCHGPDIAHPPSVAWCTPGCNSLCAFHDYHLEYRSPWV